MGNCLAGISADEKARRKAAFDRNKDLEDAMAREKKAEQFVSKLLLLGAGMCVCVCVCVCVSVCVCLVEQAAARGRHVSVCGYMVSLSPQQASLASPRSSSR
jgi:hypothetical protein